MTKIVRVLPHVQDSVLRDPFKPVTYFPNELVNRRDVSRSALGLLLQLVATDDFDAEAAREAELKRRASGIPAEDVDELLDELEAAGYVSVAEE